MIAYLITADIEQGIKDCRDRGWTQIARCLFVTGESRADRFPSRWRGGARRKSMAADRDRPRRDNPLSVVTGAGRCM